MRNLPRAALALALTGSAAACITATTASAEPTKPAATPGPTAAAPYVDTSSGNAPKLTDVMRASGIKNLTLGFILSDGGCNPTWNGNQPLDGPNNATIQQIRSAGGDAMPSIGGYNGTKLGDTCPDGQALAAAYQKVIDSGHFQAIDIDIEASEFENQQSQDKVLEAVKTVKEHNPGLRVVITFPTMPQGPTQPGLRMIDRASQLQSTVDLWSSMAFDFGGNGGKDMVANTITATDALKEKVKSAFHLSDADAYAHVGVTSMNGKTDSGELVDQAAFEKIAYYAKAHRLGRLTFWSVNRDRPCPGGGGDLSTCSGVPQQPWEFSKIVAGFQG